MNTKQKQELATICDRLSNVASVISREVAEEETDVGMVYLLAIYLQDLEAELLTIPHMKEKV